MAVLPPVPGTEGRLVWGTGTDTLTLNDKTAGLPRYYVSTMGGWRSTGDVELPAEANTGRMGERPRLGFRRGKTITLEGVTQAQNLAALRSAEDDLIDAFWDTTQEQRLEIQTKATPGGVWVPRYFLMARPVSVDGPEMQPVSPFRETSGYERSFVVTLRLSDPTFYFVTQTVATGPLLSASGSGVLVPFTPPITLPAGASGGSLSVTNDGKTDANPIIRLDGPIKDPDIYNDTIGRHLSLLGVEIGSGSWIDIDFKERKVLLESVSDFRNYRAGDWWDRNVPGLVPGLNTIRVLGSQMSSPQTRITVSFFPGRH